MGDLYSIDHSRRTFIRFAGTGLGGLILGADAEQLLAQTNNSPLKIGSIGAGHMGGALGELFVKAGHEVMFSSRHPDQIKPLASRLGPRAHIGTVEQAIAFGDVIVLVVPYAAVEEIGKAHARAIAAKPLLLDICNPYPGRESEALIKWVEEQGGAGLATSKLIPGAKVVRAFNGLGADAIGGMAHHSGNNGVPIAGDDPKAVAMAEDLIRGMGFEPVLIGGLAKAKYLVGRGPMSNVRVPAMLRQIALTLK